MNYIELKILFKNGKIFGARMTVEDAKTILKGMNRPSGTILINTADNAMALINLEEIVCATTLANSIGEVSVKQ